jgi:hypothetical protein
LLLLLWKGHALFLAQADYEHQSIRTAVTQEMQFHIENTEISVKHLMPVDIS